MTSYTEGIEEEKLGQLMLGFGVIAPYTAQGTPLEEDGGSDPRPIVDGVSLDIEYPALEDCADLFFHAQQP